MTATVVLVHGAWHGGWCFERVTDALASRGVPALAPDLPGHGQDSGPLGDLHADAARVTETLDRLEGPVVLLGHSYGGAVITEAGHHPSVVRLVYLCAFALGEGESCMSLATGDASVTISPESRPDMGAAFEFADGGTIALERSQAAAILYNDCAPADAAWALDRLGPQPIVTLRQAPHVVAWTVRPSSYVVCTKDMAIHPELQRLMAERCSERVEWASDHSPFLSRPAQVIDLLAGLAASA